MLQRLFTIALATIAFVAPAVAAPFVPVRDPQVVAFSPSGTLVATGCSGQSDSSFPPRPHPDVRKCGVVALWDIASGKRLWRGETFGDLTQLEFSPDGTLLAACRLYTTSDGLSLNEVRLWDVASGQIVKTLDRCHAFAFAPDSKRLAVLSRTRCVVYALGDWIKEQQTPALGGAVSVQFLPDGEQLVGVVRAEDKYHLAIAPIGAEQPLLVSNSLDQPFYRVAVSPNGNLLATGHEGGGVLLWDAATLEPKLQWSTGEPGLAHPRFHPSGEQIAALSQASGGFVVWDIASKLELHRYAFDKGTFRTHMPRAEADTFRPEKDPQRFAIAPDGESFLVGAYGGMIRQLEDGAEVRRFGD